MFFLKRKANRSIDSVARCFIVENLVANRRRCTSDGSAKDAFKACFKLSKRHQRHHVQTVLLRATLTRTIILYRLII